MTNPWKNASSIADLGNAMADWLEGRGPTWPGYLDSQPDNETRHLIPTLVACCRAGFVTTCSQPGEPPTRGYDGRIWRQRAFVEGWIADGLLLTRIRQAVKAAGLTAIAHGPSSRGGTWTPVTDANGEICAAVGNHAGHRRTIATNWDGVGRHAIRELRGATHLALLDPNWGRDNRLWPALDRAVGR